MIKRPVTLTLFALILCVIGACEKPEPEPFDSDPILAVGHAVFVGTKGKELVPDTTFVKRAQGYYINALLEGSEKSADVQRSRKLVYELVKDKVYANALFIDWLIEKRAPSNVAHMATVNNALRWHYYLYIQKRPVPDDRREWAKGVDDEEVAEDLEEAGFVVYAITNNSGRAYVDECRDAGVPVPDAMFSSEWSFRGVFDKEFISEASQAELYVYESDSPAGVCLALPRYPGSMAGSSDEAGLLGIICLGTQSNKSCFFDNPNGRAFPRDVEVSINEFVGGTDLVINGQGTCTDCHAGENPYVVHPEKSAFSGLAPMPGGWPDPLVDASWPQNPGPTNLLDPVSSTASCDSCHRVGSAGRFPEVSDQLKGYCGTVFGTAVTEDVYPDPFTPDASKRTMPPFGEDKSQYMAHINEIRVACNNPPSGGGVVVDVDFDDDTSFISPPVVIDPLYSCTERVSVQSTILDAKVTLFVNGTAIDPPIESRNPRLINFDIPALMSGDQVFARQESGSAANDSAVITVSDYTVDYPAGVPTPSVDPALIHECAGIIAVRHIGGAKVTVFSNGVEPRTYTTGSYGWTMMRPAKQPFVIGDDFSAEAALCGDKSGVSAVETAVAAPGTMPTPGLNPATTFEGQELVNINNLAHGGVTSVSEASFGDVGKFETPISWKPDYDVATRIGSPLSTGDVLSVGQELCAPGPVFTGEPAVRCDELPAPRIGHPIVGRNWVVVTSAVPGARIRVYDDSGDELGDSSGTIIMLKRAITGVDILTVTQQVGECNSGTGYRVSVRNPKAQDDG